MVLVALRRCRLETLFARDRKERLKVNVTVFLYI